MAPQVQEFWVKKEKTKTNTDLDAVPHNQELDEDAKMSTEVQKFWTNKANKTSFDEDDPRMVSVISAGVPDKRMSPAVQEFWANMGKQQAENAKAVSFASDRPQRQQKARGSNKALDFWKNLEQAREEQRQDALSDLAAHVAEFEELHGEVADMPEMEGVREDFEERRFRASAATGAASMEEDLPPQVEGFLKNVNRASQATRRERLQIDLPSGGVGGGGSISRLDTFELSYAALDWKAEEDAGMQKTRTVDLGYDANGMLDSRSAAAAISSQQSDDGQHDFQRPI